jgi:uncharacterized RDD family membrane protein YckC
MAPSRSPFDRVMGAIVPRAVDAIDPDDVLERLDLDAVLARVDLDALLDRLDLDAVLDRVDLDTVLARLDLDALMARIDVDALIGRVDVNRLVQQVDIDGLVSQVNVNALVGQVDVDRLVSQVDIDALIGRVDVDRLVQQVDVQGLIGRVDLNELLAGVDLAPLMARAGIDQIVADATSGMAARTLDLARRQLLRVDLVVLALVDRALGRRRAGAAPPVDTTVTGGDAHATLAPTTATTAAPRRWAAGPVARSIAFLVDSVAVSALFGLAVSLGGFLLGLFTTRSLDRVDGGGMWWVVAFLAWWFCYLWLTVAVAGRTIGKGLVGLRVVAVDGIDLSPRAAAVRALLLPFSLVLGLGFLPAVFGRQRRAVHDFVAGSRVDVDWGPRPVTTPASWDRWTAPASPGWHGPSGAGRPPGPARPPRRYGPTAPSTVGPVGRQTDRFVAPRSTGRVSSLARRPPP